MRSEVKGAVLAGALTLSGIGGLPKPVVAETGLPHPIVEPNRTASRLSTENPTLVFNQEAYVPNEADFAQISSVAEFFLDAGLNPQFQKEMSDRYFNEFENYFGILKDTGTFGFQYNPFGKDNDVIVEFYSYEEVIPDPSGDEFTYLYNALHIVVGDDGTINTPRESVELFPIEVLPEVVEANIVMDGMENVEWQSDLADPSIQIVLKEIKTPFSTYLATGDTRGYLLLSTESITPITAEQ